MLNRPAAATTLFAGLATAATLSACLEGDSAGIEPAFIASVVAHTLSPGQDAFAARSAALADAADAYCDAPSDAGLQAARDAWHAARGQWKQLQVFAFGPYRAFPERYGFNIDFYPPRYGTIDELIAGDAAIDAATVSALGTTARGLPVVEYLLFADAAPDARRCEALTAVARDLANLARDNADAWNHPETGFVHEMLAPGDAFEDTHEVFVEVLSRMGFTLEDIRTDRLLAPLGDTADGTPDPTLLESRPSGRSLQDIADMVDGIEAVFDGPAEVTPESGAEGVGVADLLRQRRRADLVDAFDTELADVRAAIAAVPEPLEASLTDAEAAVRALEVELGELQRVLQAEVGNVLAGTLSFNDTDGD